MDFEAPSTAYPAINPLPTLFRPAQTFDCWCDQYSANFTCFAFSPCESNIIIGSSDGKIEVRNIQTGEDVVTYERDRRDRYAELLNMEPNRTGELLLTSDSHQPSSLWSLENLQCKHQFEQMDHVEFSKNTQDKIVGNKKKCAFIYDVSTGLELMRLNPKTSKHHSRNQATFHPSDDVILFGDSLWDARCSTDKPIHKFYHLNDTIGGTFHPNGYEIVACSGIWDTRTFGLLRTVPDLEDCKVTFSNSGQIIYALRLHYSGPPDLYEFDFKTFDARDYTPIGTFVSDNDCRRAMQGIYGLCCNSSDTQIAVGWGSDSGTPCQATVQLYDVGLSNDDVEDEESNSSDGDDIDGDTEDEASDVDSDEDVDRRFAYPVLLDECLSLNTMGVSTGCDNMTNIAWLDRFLQDKVTSNAQKRPLPLEESLQDGQAKKQQRGDSDEETSSSSDDDQSNDGESSTSTSDGETTSTSDDDQATGGESTTTTSSSDDEVKVRPVSPRLLEAWNLLTEQQIAKYPYLVNGFDSMATLKRWKADMKKEKVAYAASFKAGLEELKKSKK